MAHTFLLEIGVEEMPAHVVTPSVHQLADRMAAFLKEQRLAYDQIEQFSTPRRLALKVTGLADKQDDISTEAKGPAKKIAQDEDGNWTKAAIGFSRGQGMTPDDIFFKELKGTEYAYVKKFVAGKPADEVLQDMAPVITKMNFPTMMRWGTQDFKFIRPIRWLVALLDDAVVPLTIRDISAGKESQGHRFLGHPVTIKQAADYPEVLKDEWVIADAAARKQMITTQIGQLAQQHDWQINVEPGLLEEVNNLVEYPTVFAGNFDEKYLQVPDAVLITSMRDHQRFFYVTDHAGKLLPHFVSVRNGNAEYLDNVVAGNEKVLTARLEDAKFFYEEDQKTTIANYVEQLKKVSFHDKIGTIYEKMQRVDNLAQQIGQQVGLTADELAHLHRAAQIYKFDLVTGMVGEFAELQGTMGEIYARLQGEDEAVAVAMREEYMPTSADGALPQSKVGAVLAIADKLDSIQAFFAAGMLPSGSNDPYALRRQALGIIRIIKDQGWNLGATALEGFVDQAAQQLPALYKTIPATGNRQQMTAFMMDRVAQLLHDTKYRHDIIETVVAGKGNAFPAIFKAAQVLSDHSADADFKETIEALTRVVRLSKKAGDLADLTVDPALFENDSERQLNDAVAAISAGFAKQDVAGKYAALAGLKDVISTYFDATMIMSDNEQVKNNHLKQLVVIARLTRTLGDLTQLIVK